MRFPSIHQLSIQTVFILRTYPLELASALTGTYAAAQLSFHNAGDFEQFLIRLIMTAALALPAFLAVTLRGRYRGHSAGRRGVEYALVAVLLLLFHFSIGKPVMQRDVTRFFMLDIAAHLLVACAGFLGRGSTPAFWLFNRHLFLSIITAGIFSAALFAGLAGALAAVDALFHTDLDDRWYLRLFCWIAGIFNTLVFLAGVPRQADLLEQEHSYPRVLKVFTQFVLVPLVLIYLLILLAYESKIVVQWQLPNGWVSNLIIGYGVVGILSILLVYPIRDSEGNTWMRLFARWFYVLLLPLVALMYVAIITRINDYGFTEERVFVLVLAIWLTGIAFFFLLRPRGDIRIIPASLALIILLLSSGPGSVFRISRENQRARLQQLLEKNRLLDRGRAVKRDNTASIPFGDKKSISTTIHYLLEHHGIASVTPWFDTATLKKGPYDSWDNTRTLLARMGLPYFSPYATEGAEVANGSWIGFSSGPSETTITGYDVYLPLLQRYRESPGFGSLYISRGKDNSFTVMRNGKAITATVRPEVTMRALISRYGAGVSGEERMEGRDLQVQLAGQGCTVLVQYHHLRGFLMDSTIRDLDYDGAVFVKWE